MVGLALVEARLDHSVAVGSSEWHPAIVIFRADIGHPVSRSIVSIASLLTQRSRLEMTVL